MSDSILLKAMVPVELASKFMQLIFFFSLCLLHAKKISHLFLWMSELGERRWMDIAQVLGKGALMGTGVCSRTCCSIHEIFCSTGWFVTTCCCTCSFSPFRPPGDNRIFWNRPCGSGLFLWNLRNLCTEIPTLFVWPVRRCSICSKTLFSVLIVGLFCRNSFV